MMRGVEIRYGVISDITTTHLTAIFDSKSACASCHAQGSCTSLDRAQKEIVVAKEGEQESLFTIGEEVMIEMPTRDGQVALIIANVIPILVLLCVIAVASIWFSDLIAAWIAITALFIYFFSLKFILKGFSFRIRIKKIPPT